MRLIDADAIRYDQLLNIGNKERPHEWAVSQSSINSMPTIDAVEVVRCRDCRWFGEEDEDGQCWCFFNNVPTLRFSYCYFGERRKDDKD